MEHYQHFLLQQKQICGVNENSNAIKFRIWWKKMQKEKSYICMQIFFFFFFFYYKYIYKLNKKTIWCYKVTIRWYQRNYYNVHVKVKLVFKFIQKYQIGVQFYQTSIATNLIFGEKNSTQTSFGEKNLLTSFDMISFFLF